MSIPEIPLVLSSLDELIGWTTTYFHFKQVLEQVPLQAAEAEQYLMAFDPFRERRIKEMKQQAALEA